MYGYVELHCHTNYSLLDGASHPEDLLDRAQALGIDTLAVTDHDGLYGMVHFYHAARERGIKPIVGAELALEGGYHLVLLAKEQTGYANLCRLISHAQLSQSKGNASLSFETLKKHTEGLFGLSGCRRGEIASHLLARRRKEALEAGMRYVRLFGKENFWIELQNHLLPDDQRLIAELV
jgi:DNA polymerase III alpha subunit